MTKLLALCLYLFIPALVVLVASTSVVGEYLGVFFIGFRTCQVRDVYAVSLSDNVNDEVKAFKDGGKEIVVEVNLSLKQRGKIYETCSVLIGLMIM